MSLIGVLNLRLQAFTPSDHMWSTRLLEPPPQFLNQAPPGAQQLTRPDVLNVPHLLHVIVAAIAGPCEVSIGVLDISSRSGMRGRAAYGRVVAGVGAGVHSDACNIEPDVPSNMRFLLAFEWTQAAAQSFALNDVAP